MSDFSVSITDNTELVLHALEIQKEAALTAVGIQAASYARRNITEAGKVGPTGNLRNSITSEVRMSEDAVYVGSNVEYAKYIEYGTGKFGDKPTGSGWWVYVTGQKNGKNKVKGKRYTKQKAAQIVARMRAQGIEAHMTQGQKPTHFLKNAITQHTEQFKAIAEKHLKG